MEGALTDEGTHSRLTAGDGLPFSPNPERSNSREALFDEYFLFLKFILNPQDST